MGNQQFTISTGSDSTTPIILTFYLINLLAARAADKSLPKRLKFRSTHYSLMF